MDDAMCPGYCLARGRRGGAGLSLDVLGARKGLGQGAAGLLVSKIGWEGQE